MRLVKAKLGSYLEVAYEWTYEEAMDMLEILDLTEEYQRRNELINKAGKRG